MGFIVVKRIAMPMNTERFEISLDGDPPYFVMDDARIEPYISGKIELGKVVHIGQYRMYVHEHLPEHMGYLVMPDQLNYRIWSKFSKLVYIWQGFKLRMHLTAYVWGLAKRPGSYL